jgi:hypothetical protein
MDKENTRLPSSVVLETSEAGGDGASVWEDMALPRGGASTTEPPRRKDRRRLRGRSEGAAPPEPKRAIGAVTWRAARAKPRETRRRDAINGSWIGQKREGWIVFFSLERRGCYPCYIGSRLGFRELHNSSVLMPSWPIARKMLEPLPNTVCPPDGPTQHDYKLAN